MNIRSLQESGRAIHGGSCKLISINLSNPFLNTYHICTEWLPSILHSFIIIGKSIFTNIFVVSEFILLKNPPLNTKPFIRSPLLKPLIHYKFCSSVLADLNVWVYSHMRFLNSFIICHPSLQISWHIDVHSIVSRPELNYMIKMRFD